MPAAAPELARIAVRRLWAQDERAQIPSLHLHNSTLGHLDPAVARLAVDFAKATVRHLAASHPLSFGAAGCMSWTPRIDAFGIACSYDHCQTTRLASA